jgi:2-oxo-4-hydroxy-4-carboxy--5-ureidoimidazoline (OHCU) decarboxylase
MLNPDRAASRPGVFSISAHNDWAEARAAAAFPATIDILDSTLRKTYFTAGNRTSLSGFARIAEALVELGITDTCLNVTWGGDTEPTPQDWALMRTILDADLPLRVNVWSEVLLGNGRDPQAVSPREGLERLVDAGASIVAPGIVPAPDADAEKRQMEQLDEHLARARELGVTTTITMAQVGMRDFDQLVRTATHAVRGGAVRVDLMDSGSTMSPETMRVFVRRFRSAVPGSTRLSMHAHHEFGLSTAAALAAVAEGAMPDVSMNAMSYRGGFSATEEVVMALEVFYGVDTGLDLGRLSHVSRVVAEESGLPVPQLKALTGRYAHLKHMPGDAEAVLRRGQGAFPPISHLIVPEVMGSQVAWVWGAASSNSLTDALATAGGITLSQQELPVVRRALDEATAAIEEYPRWLRPEEASAILRRTVDSLRGDRFLPAVGDVVGSAVADPALAAELVAALGTTRYDRLPDASTITATTARVVQGLSNGRLIDLLEGFNRFGEHGGGGRPELSSEEEAAIAGSDAAEQADLLAAARAYEERFGFRPVVAARGRDAAAVTAVLREGLDHNATTELSRTRAAVADILAARITWSAGE